MSLPGQILPCHGSTIWDARRTSASFPIPRADIRSIATRACAASPAIATITFPSIWAAATSMCATTSRASSGRPPGSPRDSDVEQYTCRHGMGYTIIGSKHRGIEASTRYFVPLDENLEIWQFTVTNHRPTPAALSIFSRHRILPMGCAGRLHQFSAQLQHRRGGRSKTASSITRPNTASAAIISPGSPAPRKPPGSIPSARLSRPHRGWDRPAVVERGESANSVAHGWAPIGSHHVGWSCAGRDATDPFCFGLPGEPQGPKIRSSGSQTVNKKTAKPVIARYLVPANVDAAFRKLRAYWDGLLGICQVPRPTSTPTGW